MPQDRGDQEKQLGEPALFGDFISFLRWLPGEWSQVRLATKAGIDRSDLRRYEKGKTRPREATFQLIREAVGVPQRLIGFLRWCHRLVRGALALDEVLEPPATPALTEASRAAVVDIVERALALGRAEEALLRSAPRRLGPPAEEDQQRVEALFERLKAAPPDKQRLLIRRAPSYCDPLLCLHICKVSEHMAPHAAKEALALAELALLIAAHVEESVVKPRLQGWCTAHIANAERVIGRDFPGALATFARAWRLWHEGQDPAGLFSEAHMLHLEASLRNDLRQFNAALRLHNEALKKARPEERGGILLNKACIFQVKGDHEEALRTLAQAAQAIDAARQPRLRCVLRFNQASNLLLLGRAGEAAPIVAEVRELVERLRNSEDLVRTLWLEGNCAAGLGQRDEALLKLEQVRHEFEVRENPFDYALASLDLALLYREVGRFADIKLLAAQMVEIFKAQKVDREALAAVLLFQEAAEKEQVTAGLVRRLQDQLSKARGRATT